MGTGLLYEEQGPWADEGRALRGIVSSTARAREQRCRKMEVGAHESGPMSGVWPLQPQTVPPGPHERQVRPSVPGAPTRL